MGAAKKQKKQDTDDSELGQIARNMAHEINSPLGAIKLHAEYILELAQEHGDSQELEKSSEGIIKSVDKITKIINAVRSYVRLNFKSPFLSSRVSELLEDALSEVTARMENSAIALKTPPFDTKLTLQCRFSEVVQILTNLLRNSIDAIDELGLDEKWIEIKVEEENEFISLTVTDSGPGIPQEIQEQIFQPLFSTKTKDKGMGVGLALCMRMANIHGGSISLDTASSNTSFILRLPKEQQGLFVNDLSGEEEGQ